MKAILHTDGGARGNPGPSGFGALLFDTEYHLIDFDGGYNPHATNNFAEYNALQIGIELAVKNNISELICKLDSELAVKQLTGLYKIKDENIKIFHSKIVELEKEFKSIDFIHVPREENKFADKLVNLLLDVKNE